MQPQTCSARREPPRWFRHGKRRGGVRLQNDPFMFEVRPIDDDALSASFDFDLLFNCPPVPTLISGGKFSSESGEGNSPISGTHILIVLNISVLFYFRNVNLILIFNLSFQMSKKKKDGRYPRLGLFTRPWSLGMQRREGRLREDREEEEESV